MGRRYFESNVTLQSIMSLIVIVVIVIIVVVIISEQWFPVQLFDRLYSFGYLGYKQNG